ncbi:MAG: hypothetical protein D6727_00280 [Gammaproteobacteria bacterium]|nr:MAG: hypothetical protein D6727_00280 [Gammaproteobacteria bacterium]
MNKPAQLQHWHIAYDNERIAWLCLDKAGASTNVLSQSVLSELNEVLDRLQRDPPRGLVVYSGKDSGFIAGADISEFPALREREDALELTLQGHALFARLEQLPWPSVAAINGHALGGGLELALACGWRIALDSSRRSLGLPEVKLGLHPGLGGTVRLVRLIGVRAAMPMMLTGDPVTPGKAKKLGLVDRVVSPEDWREHARELARRRPPTRRAPWPDRLLSLGPVRGLLAGQMEKQVARRAKREHYPAPYAMIELWRRYAARGQRAFEAEARSFVELMRTPTSAHLVRVYGLQERLKREAGEKRDVAAHVHVVGAGVMGGDIAAWCAMRGLSVTLQDREMKYIEPALQRAGELFDKRLRGPGEADAARARLQADVDGLGVPQADIVIEAIFEDRDAKQALYRALEPRMQDSAILATNTSSIPLQELAPALEQPGRLVGLHFFNPVAKLPLVEVVSAPQTAADTAALARAFTRQIGKLPLPCRSLPGFLVNRILAPYMAEAMELAREGVPLPLIDRAATDFGMPMGPVELADSVGLDIALHVSETLASVIGRPIAPELKTLVEAGKLGRKSGEGFYAYRDGKPQKERVSGPVDPELSDRLMLAYLNEAANCLADEVVGDPDLVDAGAIFGTGFAPFRGGPMRYAWETGIDRIEARLRELAERHGERFSPSAGWQRVREFTDWQS